MIHSPTVLFKGRKISNKKRVFRSWLLNNIFRIKNPFKLIYKKEKNFSYAIEK
jgi:hypothetical protein